MYNRKPEYLVLDIDYQIMQIAAELKNLIADLLANYADHLTDTRVEQTTFEEVVRQVFDYMTDDFSQFEKLIHSFPNYSRFQHAELYIRNSSTNNEIVQLCRSIAIGFFFQMRDLGLFNTTTVHGFHFILREVGETHIVLERTPET